ncbi:MAG: HAMP domain-containing sensor histidine kinase [Ferruginibacter sp.]
MQHLKTFKHFLKRNIYLLIIAAWIITIAIIIDNYWSVNSSLFTVQKTLSSYVQKSEIDFKKLTSDTTVTNNILTEYLSEEELLNLVKKDYFIYFYSISKEKEYQLKFWNTQSVFPNWSLLYLNGNSGFVKLQNGYYVWNIITNKNFKAIALIPVKWNYIITNEYLKNNFAVNESISLNYDLIAGSQDGFSVNSIYGDRLFNVIQKSYESIVKNNIASVVLIIIAFFIILIFIQLIASYISKEINKPLGYIFFIFLIAALRIISYREDFPINFRQFELFDPSVYSSNPILRSLGDLLINSALFVWVTLFLRAEIQDKQVQLQKYSFVQKWAMLIFGSLVIIVATYVGTYTIRSLVADSQISFDVLNFFSLNFYSIIGFIVLCCIAIGYFFFCQIIIFALKPLYQSNFLNLFLTVAIVSLIILSFRIGSISGGNDIYILAWLLCFIFLLNNNFLNLLASKIISSRLVFWVFLFSISITGLIIIENRSKELRNRKHYAEILATKADPSSETLINSMLTDFRENYLADNFDRFLSPILNQEFKDSLVEGNFSGYTDRYDTKIFSFNAKEEPLFNKDSTGYNDLNTILNTEARPTGVPNLYYYDVAYDKFSYISKKHLRDTSGNLLGYVFIIANLKRDKNDALYPVLFNRGRPNSIENSSHYAFAIYNNLKLISSHNDYPFSTTIAKNTFPVEQYFIVSKYNYNELWYNAGGGRMVVIAKQNNLGVESMTLFSYIFCAFLILTAILWLLNVFFNSGFSWRKMRLKWQFNIRNQIHGTIIFICVLSFLIIGIATILFFISRYENNNREKLSMAIHIMEKEVKSSMSFGWNMRDSSARIGNEERVDLVETIKKISEIHGIDVNLYDLKGHLQASSLPLPYNKGIVSTIMDPVAYYHLHQNNEVQYFQKEHIGSLSYISSYKPVIDEHGYNYAYLNIPYFTSETKLKEEISNFLVTIINLNAFIFLIAGIVALFIANKITRTFSFISEEMKKINLGKKNEVIKWARKDEIGQLVNEFNKMVSKLDESALALAKTEREDAWREMAKQIAHEIKNPLTPMKLSMQYLQKAIDMDAPNVKELTESVANTLVEQIDHLSHIASEFSQFANIENSKKEIVDINHVILNIIQLYQTDDSLDLTYSIQQGKYFILADKTHLSRIFTNLLQNAKQAADSGDKAHVFIKEIIDGKNIIISVKDSGQGIPEEIREKIFMPNFTTKSSGTGLGLAMIKRMTEYAGGDVWFDSVVGESTTFYVKFPLSN